MDGAAKKAAVSLAQVEARKGRAVRGFGMELPEDTSAHIQIYLYD